MPVASKHLLELLKPSHGHSRHQAMQKIVHYAQLAEGIEKLGLHCRGNMAEMRVEVKLIKK
jgi:hypothetical protein